MNTLISSALCFLMTAALLSGDSRFVDFAYYFQIVTNVLGWLFFIPMFNKEESRSKFKSRLWLIIPPRMALVIALVCAGFPGVAVSAFLLLAFMVVASTTKTPTEKMSP